MKKNIVLIITLISAVVVSLVSPKIVENSAVSVEVTSVYPTSYSDDIHANGVVEALSKKDVTVKLPIVPEKIHYEIGDYVEVNQILADVDVEATTAALFSLAEMTKLVPQEYISILSTLNVQENLLKDIIPLTIISPASGVITDTSLLVGATSTPNSSIITISNQERLRAKLAVNETDIDKISVGDTVLFKANATGDVKYSGKVDLIFPAASKSIVGTSQATVVNLYVALDENYPSLKSGFTINGVIKSNTQSTVNFLPYECVIASKDNVEYIYIVEGNKTIACPVVTGRELSDGVEIISPSLFGQKVVLNPNDIKKENDIIKIVNN